MGIIDLAFSPEMARAALGGRKWCTSRRERKGCPGDVFEIDGVWFRIIDIQPYRIHSIATTFYRLEGFVDIAACGTALQQLYPDLSQDDELNVHFFARCVVDWGVPE